MMIIELCLLFYICPKKKILTLSFHSHILSLLIDFKHWRDTMDYAKCLDNFSHHNLQKWSDLGFSFLESIQWISEEISPEEAYMWIVEGFNFSSAMPWISAGYSSQVAAMYIDMGYISPMAAKDACISANQVTAWELRYRLH